MPHPGEQGRTAVIVQPLGHSLVVLRRVIQWKVEVLAALMGAGDRHQPASPFRVHTAPTALEPGAALAAHLEARACACELGPVLGDDVDHAKEGVGAVDGRTWAG